MVRSCRIFDGDEKQALCHVLVKSEDRKWDIIEQAGLIQQLHRRHGLSQHQIAHLLGKGQSWVSRRLTLLDSLPEPVISCLRQGRISSWAAARVLAPMARANTDHVQRLTDSLIEHPLSTRQLFAFFDHYSGITTNFFNGIAMYVLFMIFLGVDMNGFLSCFVVKANAVTGFFILTAE